MNLFTLIIHYCARDPASTNKIIVKMSKRVSIDKMRPVIVV